MTTNKTSDLSPFAVGEPQTPTPRRTPQGPHDVPGSAGLREKPQPRSWAPFALGQSEDQAPTPPRNQRRLSLEVSDADVLPLDDAVRAAARCAFAAEHARAPDAAARRMTASFSKLDDQRQGLLAASDFLAAMQQAGLPLKREQLLSLQPASLEAPRSLPFALPFCPCLRWRSC